VVAFAIFADTVVLGFGSLVKQWITLN
jgi:beta-glucosidase/6-phospho-beta-glucosidase/beta-galactosidase